MANSTLMNLTSADSSILTDSSSFLFYGMLADGTSVGVPGSELKKRVSGINKEVMVYRASSIYLTHNVYTDYVSAAVESVIYDPNVWYDATSTTVLRVPSDKIELAVFFANHRIYGHFNASDDNTSRVSALRYTTVTSTKYSQQYPFLGTGSLSTLLTFDQRIFNGNWAELNVLTPPIHVESGDQFIYEFTSNVIVNTPVLRWTTWGFYGLTYR